MQVTRQPGRRVYVSMLVGASRMLLQRRSWVSTLQYSILGVASSFGSGDLERQSSLSQGLSVLYARCEMQDVRCKMRWSVL
jgi:hypothetical protein